MKLNIGAGGVPLAGYTPVDRKFGSEAYPLAYPDESVDEVRASHVLEHFSWHEVPKVLADWHRVLKPGGTIKVAVPNMRWIADNINDRMALAYTMGGQTDANDYHKSAFTPESLTAALEAAGFDGVTTWNSEIQDCASLPVSLNLMATKGEVLTKNPVKIAAVMSMPRLCFSENMFSCLQALTPLGIPLTKVTGAFWGQCIERGMQMHMDDSTEWLLTIDYDTVFDLDTLMQLCRLMGEHPEADAIAPVQIKREENFPLVTMEDENGKRISTVKSSVFDRPLTRIASSHFGLTLFRVEALKRMKHPWFWGQPNADGEWGEHRVDDDIYFWKKWKESGNSLYLANRVHIGHLQLMVTWPGEGFKPVHQYTTDYAKNGRPVGSSPLAPVRSPSAAPGFGGAN
jgi:hypothetical protein